MKRPIKFRAWDGKKMLQNVGTHPHMIKSLIKMPNCDNQDSDCEYKKDDEGAYIISQAFDAYTLMQFTGLKDKGDTGNELYESDIVECEVDGGEEGIEIVWCRIDYDNELAMFTINGKIKSLTDGVLPHLSEQHFTEWWLPLADARNVTKLGNIYQNPELLK